MVFRLFFIGGGGGQIRGVDDGHTLSARRQKAQKPPNQLLINPTQGRHARLGAELREHAHVRDPLAVREPGETPPGRLLRQQAYRQAVYPSGSGVQAFNMGEVLGPLSEGYTAVGLNR